MTNKLTRSEKWDKEEKGGRYIKCPSNVPVFPGIKKAVVKLLSLLNHNSSYPVTIDVWYKNPWHHFALVKYSYKKINVYMNGRLLDPKFVLS